MNNPIYNAMNGNKRKRNIVTDFADFMNQNKGKNPDQMIQAMLQSGQISQEQLNAAQQKAEQMRGVFDGMAAMFGFRK